MSSQSARQIQCYAWLLERWIQKPLVSRDEERIRLGQRRQALLVFAIPTGSLIFTLIVTMLFAAHADPFLTEAALYCSFAYSDLASWRSGRSGSAPFQAAKKS